MSKLNFFRRADQPTERETFLAKAITSLGFTEEQVSDAFKAQAADFLGVIKEGSEYKAKAEALTVERDTFKSKAEAYASAIKALGLEPDSADLAKDYNEKLELAASKKAQEQLAARGVKPVPQAVSGSDKKDASSDPNVTGFERVRRAFKNQSQTQ